MRMNNHNKWVCGFTVMEIIVTLGMASIVMGIATPAFLTWLPTLRLSSAARQVAIDLQVARMRAISQNTPYTVTFTPSTSTYSYTGASRNVAQEYPGITISTAPSNPPVTFSPRGTASTAGTITLSNGSATKDIVVSSVGRVKVQ